MDIIGQLFTLIMLLLLQAVLGFDNLLYISIESKRAPKDRQAYVRKLGIGIAVLARIILLFLLTSIISAFTNPFFVMPWKGWIEGQLNLESIIVLFGGIFILYTAVKEIFHMIGNDQLGGDHADRKFKSPARVILTIVFMNLVFSFDSILSAMALAQEPVPLGKVAVARAICPFKTSVNILRCSALGAPMVTVRVTSVVPSRYWPPESTR